MGENHLNEGQPSPVKQALAKLRDMRAELDEIRYRRHEPIAIVGVGVRFPGGADSAETYWRLLREGFDAVVETPLDRWDTGALYDPNPDAPGKLYSRHGGFLDRIDCFDPGFFGISPREAASIDPQQRILLEVGWQALESAGYGPEGVTESTTGFFLAISNSDYYRMSLAPADCIDAYTTTGSAFSLAASRLSYFLNLKGPSIAIDTACSSSLVALHLAVQSLRMGECSMALVGGVNLILTPELTINFCKSRMLSVAGKCRTFDAGADGYVRGEGCAVLVIKRLSDALSDGDNIVAVIRGSAINQDGRSGGITAPNGPAQEAVILAALKDANVLPRQVDYVEAHGTATPLGDPIEARALGAVLGRNRTKDRRLAVGSVKTNIGHLEAAAGLAGLIKVALALKHGEIPPHLHLDRISPHIPLDELGLFIPSETISWPAGEGPRIAGVSSFGLSGTNAHVLLQAPDEMDSADFVAVSDDAPDRPLHVLTLSAKSGSQLKEVVQRFDNHLAMNPGEPFRDVCFTANTGRAHLNHRLAIVAGDRDQARAELSTFLDEKKAPVQFHAILEEDTPQLKLAFIFTGQGAQYVGMGRHLFETEPFFRGALERCEELLVPYLGAERLLRIIYPSHPGDSPLLNDALYAGPALFALEYALVALWRSWGIKPSAVMGHGVGEYAAACAAGVFALEDALKLVVRRAQMGSPQQNGEMAVQSHPLEPIPGPFEDAVAGTTFSKPRITLISGMTSQAVSGDEVCRPSYWRQQLSGPARSLEFISTLLRQGYRTFVEIGPEPALSAMARRSVTEAGVVWLPSLRRETDDWTQMLESLSALYALGWKVDWKGFDHDRPRRRRPLPTYPFQEERHWMDVRTPVQSAPSPGPFAAWRSAVEAGRRQSEQGPLSLRPESYEGRWRCLERLSRAFMIQALSRLGAFTQTGESLSADEVLGRCSILPTYRYLLHRWLIALTEEGILDVEQERFRSPRLPGGLPALDVLPVESHLKAAREAFADQPEFMDYIERCGEMAAEVLTGKQPALETLFPGGSSEVAEWLYSEFSVSRYIGGIAASVVSAFVAAETEFRPVRILEIGAGTGGTTGAVLQALPPGSADYSFTDVSEFFFSRARERFTEFPAIRYRLLDIEQPPASQGVASGGFHVVVATNVLHATRHLDVTLDHVLTLLAPGGLLVLSEVTRELAWYDITTGLIEGWQKFEDGWRKDSPILTPQKWKEILQSRGFDAVEMFPMTGSMGEVLGQHVIVARVPLGQRVPAPETGIDPALIDISSPPEATNAESSMDAEKSFREFDEVPKGERHEFIVERVLTQLARVLRLGPDRLPNRRGRLLDLGLDSLMAIELRNHLTVAFELKQKLPATLVFDYPTAEAIAGFLEREFLDGPEEARPAMDEMEETTRAKTMNAEKIAQMTDEEVESMLLEKLRRKQEKKE